MASKKKVPNVVDQLREAIVNSGQSLGEISRASGIGTDRISRFVRGERTLTLPAAARVCEVLHLELVPTPTPEEPPVEKGTKGKKRP